MKQISQFMSKLKGNISVKCKSCGSSVKNKDAHMESVKLLEYVYPKQTAFCSKKCCQDYKLREENTPKKRSTCSMCPTHPDA